MPECGFVALDCCFALFVVCLIGCYYIFKRNLFCSCATKPTPKIYEYMLTYTHDIRAENTHVLTSFFHFWGIMPISFRLLASYKRSRLPFHFSKSADTAVQKCTCLGRLSPNSTSMPMSSNSFNSSSSSSSNWNTSPPGFSPPIRYHCLAPTCFRIHLASVWYPKCQVSQCKASPTAQIVLEVRGYRPRVDPIQAHAASSLARKPSIRRRPLTSTLSRSNSLSIHRDCEIEGISLRSKQQRKESMYKWSWEHVKPPNHVPVGVRCNNHWKSQRKRHQGRTGGYKGSTLSHSAHPG